MVIYLIDTGKSWARGEGDSALLGRPFVIVLNKALQKEEAMAQGKQTEPSIWGFTRDAENLHGRLAMLGFALAVVIEWLSGEGVLHFLNLI
jgi:hypothetical protein